MEKRIEFIHRRNEFRKVSYDVALKGFITKALIVWVRKYISSLIWAEVLLFCSERCFEGRKSSGPQQIRAVKSVGF